MNSFKQWAICLVIGAVAGTLVMVMSPRGSMDKTVRAIIGIFIVAVIGMPFADMLKSGYTAESFAVYDYNDVREDMRDFMLDSFCESVKKELETVSSGFGVPLDKIFIEADIDANNCINIHKITAEICSGFSDKAVELSKILSEYAGVNVTVIAE